MSPRLLAVIELVLATLAAIGCAAAFIASRSIMDVAPIADGEPATTSVVFYPPTLGISFVLLTIAGLLTVAGVARLRRAGSDLDHIA